MICVSFSEEFVRYGQLLKDGEEYTIEVINKFPLATPFNPENINHPKMGNTLEKAFQDIRSDLAKPDDYVAVALPSVWFDISTETMDADLSEDDLEKGLNWKIAKRLGQVAEQKFVQYYPLPHNSGAERCFLAVSYYKDLGKLLLRASQAAEFNIHIMDIDLFSAAAALEHLIEIRKSEKWAVWLVNEQIHDMLIIESGNFSQLCRFEFPDMENYIIHHKSSASDIGEKIIADINGIRTFELETFSAVDRIFYYSYTVDSEFFNMLLTYNIENFSTIDTFAGKKPVRLYEDDGNGIGAMCQFIDLLGLMYRKIPKDSR
ncbi:MAG: hypothetical protein ACP5FZ_02155 [Fidelibacterota bacterium]